MPMDRAGILASFDKLRLWQRDGQRAVHKPLLVLLALGRLWRGESRAFEFSEIEDSLEKLLTQFGPPSAQATPHLPFWHLRTDGIWTLEGPSKILDRPPAASPSKTELRQEHVRGSFSSEVLESLDRDRTLIAALARRIVESHFPESLQQEVLTAVGMEGLTDASPGVQTTVQARRDPQFRERVLLAYEQRCCVCGHDLRLGGQVVGLEAAHIKWFQAGGPDIEPNGLAMCSLHHKLFDLGVFTIAATEFVFVVSQHVAGGGDAHQRMLSYHGAGLVGPQSATYKPSAEYVAWHRDQVFREPGRELK
jgi:putative restriction endonuclease